MTIALKNKTNSAMVIVTSGGPYRDLSLADGSVKAKATKKIPLKKFAGGVLNQLR